MKIIKKITIITLIVLLAGFYSFGTWQSAIYDTDIGSNSYNVTSLQNGDEIRQIMTCSKDGLKKISVKLNILDNNLAKGCRWILQNDKGQIIKQGHITKKMINQESFKKKQIMQFEFGKQNHSKDRKYTFILKNTNSEGNAAYTCYTTEKDKIAESLLLNKIEIQQALIIKQYVEYFNIETFVVFLGLAGYVAVFIRYMYKLFK